MLTTLTRNSISYSRPSLFSYFQDRAGGHIQTINQQFNSIANTQYYQYIHICMCTWMYLCVCVEYQTPFIRPTGCIGRLDSAGKRTLFALKRTANVRTKNIFYFNCSRTDERNYIYTHIHTHTRAGITNDRKNNQSVSSRLHRLVQREVSGTFCSYIDQEM